MKDLFRGELVRLTTEEPDANASTEIRWQKDTEFHRLASDSPIRLVSEKKYKEKIEKEAEDGFSPRRYAFSIRTLKEDEHIGFAALSVNFVHGEAWLGVGIGDREYWDKGCGTDMMKLCLQYAFTELNVHRVSLGLFEYNPRALRTYEKAGFRLEGRARKEVAREGQRYDTILMGILREEWMDQNENKTTN